MSKKDEGGGKKEEKKMGVEKRGRSDGKRK